MYIAYFDNLDHIQCISGNLNYKKKNSFHHFISSLIIWKIFIILLYFAILFFLISLKTPENEIIFKLFSFPNDMEQ